MTKLIGVPLGYIMYWCFHFVKDYGVALILFTFLTKVLLYPLAVKQQKNTAHMATFSPKLEKLKKKCGNNKEKYNEEMMKLYNEEGVNPMASCLPLLIQMPILFGLIDVVYRPLTHILRMSKTTVESAKTIITSNPDAFKAIIDNNSFKSRPELFIMEAVNQNSAPFQSMGQGFIDKVQNFDYSFLGLPMGSQPTLASILVLIPILSCLANYIFTMYSQKMSRKINPSMQQLGMGMNAMLYTMPIFSAVFAFTVPAGVGLYWIFSSVFGLLQAMLLYKIYTPDRVAAILAKQKDKRKKKPSFFQKMMEQQQAAIAAQKGVAYVPPSSVDDAEADVEVLSKSAQKDLQRKKLAEARKRYAEKYGDTFDESLD